MDLIMNALKTVEHVTDICVIGGGIGGICAALAAARNGARVVLMHDRPVLGGNASSEIRMWISGAGTRVRDLQETGIMEELLLENMYRNPKRNYSIWDSILYEKVRFEPNIELLLNCTCCDASMKDGQIESVTGFQLTTYKWHKVKAKIFIDCSGDSILAPLTGAEYRVGREAKAEFNEEFGLEAADQKTMGMSLLLQIREMDYPVSYTPPSWAYTFKTDEEMKNKPHNIRAINILLRQFYMSLPRALMEAARVDGANHFQIWSKVMMPLTKPAMVTVTVLSFINSWNEYLNALIFLPSTRNYTVSLGIQYWMQLTDEYNVMMAASASAIVPVIVLFLFTQKYFVESIASTGVKG